jgi:uncharacterized membrane protein YebE (DUF533 family)
MNFSNMINKFVGSNESEQGSIPLSQSIGSSLSGISKNVPGGLAGGAVAGGIMALLAGNKSVRKVAGKAATYGGAALLGGMAYKAYKTWQNEHGQEQTASSVAEAEFAHQALEHDSADSKSDSYQLALTKAMIAAARADGQIDSIEQHRLFKAIDEMSLSNEMKATIMDLFNQNIDVDEIAAGTRTLEEKSEIYLASCLVIDLDNEKEYAHLSALSQALQLPDGFDHELQKQAESAIKEAA